MWKLYYNICMWIFHNVGHIKGGQTTGIILKNTEFEDIKETGKHGNRQFNFLL